MFKKWVMWLPNAFIVLISLSFLTIIILPIIFFLREPPKEIQAVLLTEEKATTSAVEWLLKHHKVNYVREFPSDENSNYNLVILKDAQQINETFVEAINHKVLLAEMLAGSEKISAFGTEILHNLYGITYTGFQGKTYSDLGDTLSIPEKVITQYENATKLKWNFKGQGIVLTGPIEVFVLEKGKDYYGNLVFSEKEFSTDFSGNFEILNTASNTSANFVLNPTAIGMEKLKKLGLDPRFPAVIRAENPQFTGYYLAGDFSNTEIAMPYYMKGVDKYLSHRVIYNKDTNEKIFWKWYFGEFSKIILHSL